MKRARESGPDLVLDLLNEPAKKRPRRAQVTWSLSDLVVDDIWLHEILGRLDVLSQYCLSLTAHEASALVHKFWRTTPGFDVAVLRRPSTFLPVMTLAQCVEVFAYQFDAPAKAWDRQEACTAIVEGDESDRLPVVKWAHDHGCPLTRATTYAAAYGGHVEVLQWLHAIGCRWDEWTWYVAAGGGHVEVLQWLRAHGCPWDERTCSEAACNGRLEVLQWLHAHGCPWSKWTCFAAACRGNLEVLQWLHANGCPMDKATCIALAGDFPEVCQWLMAL